MAKLGSPENPEVISPGQAARPAAAAPPLARFKMITRLLGVLVIVLIPAVVFDWATLWMLREGWTAGNPLAWLLVVLLTPAAALSTGLALVGAPVVMLSLIFLALGRPVSISGFNVASRLKPFR